MGSALLARLSTRVGSALQARLSIRVGSALPARLCIRMGSALLARLSIRVGSTLQARLSNRVLHWVLPLSKLLALLCLWVNKKSPPYMELVILMMESKPAAAAVMEMIMTITR